MCFKSVAIPVLVRTATPTGTSHANVRSRGWHFGHKSVGGRHGIHVGRSLHKSGGPGLCNCSGSTPKPALECQILAEVGACLDKGGHKGPAAFVAALHYNIYDLCRRHWQLASECDAAGVMMIFTALSQAAVILHSAHQVHCTSSSCGGPPAAGCRRRCQWGFCSYGSQAARGTGSGIFRSGASENTFL